LVDGLNPKPKACSKTKKGKKRGGKREN